MEATRDKKGKFLPGVAHNPKGRTPGAKSKFSEAFIEAYAKDWSGDNYWKNVDECPGCREWWPAHSTLHSGLHLPPHQYPAFHHPDAANPYPAGSHAARHWAEERERDTDGAELYRQLKAAIEAN